MPLDVPGRTRVTMEGKKGVLLLPELNRYRKVAGIP